MVFSSMSILLFKTHLLHRKYEKKKIKLALAGDPYKAATISPESVDESLVTSCRFRSAPWFRRSTKYGVAVSLHRHNL